MTVTNNPAGTTSASANVAGSPRVRTKSLLTVAATTGPLFWVVAVTQIGLREGFDLRQHPISQLATGDVGVIQMINFVVAGVGVLCLALAIRRRITTGVGRRSLAPLVAVFGLGLVASGLFPMDPENGFPVGTPPGPPASMSWHSMVHSGAVALAYTALAAACVVLVVRCIRLRAVLPAVLNGLAAVVFLLPVSPTYASLQIAFIGLVALTWTTVFALRLRRAET
jgi:hypothetical membrane protein